MNAWKQLLGCLMIIAMPVIYPVAILVDKLKGYKATRFERGMGFIYFIYGCIVDIVIVCIVALGYIVWNH